MHDDADLVGEFTRDQYVFTLRRDGEVHRVEAREGDSVPIPVCHIYNPYTSPGWLSGWFLDWWRPWIELQAQRVIAEAAAAGSDREPDASTQPDHIPR
ncbi:hypothetical protein [Glycomyces sp. NPDC048151]|uniref:hypothetical protein n=1 Tax=Glycomyces sp. NPDC048151 TaxID=3364002 RepID=UPI003716DE21